MLDGVRFLQHDELLSVLRYCGFERTKQTVLGLTPSNKSIFYTCSAFDTSQAAHSPTLTSKTRFIFIDHESQVATLTSYSSSTATPSARRRSKVSSEQQAPPPTSFWHSPNALKASAAPDYRPRHPHLPACQSHPHSSSRSAASHTPCSNNSPHPLRLDNSHQTHRVLPPRVDVRDTCGR
jgi:hypothetical protein